MHSRGSFLHFDLERYEHHDEGQMLPACDKRLGVVAVRVFDLRSPPLHTYNTTRDLKAIKTQPSPFCGSSTDANNAGVLLILQYHSNLIVRNSRPGRTMVSLETVFGRPTSYHYIRKYNERLGTLVNTSYINSVYIYGQTGMIQRGRMGQSVRSP